MPKKPVKTQIQLIAENEELRRRLDEAEETLRAIRSGEVDALIVPGVGGELVFSLKDADHSYRLLIEDMNEGALTLTPEGMIMYANRRFAEMLKTPLEKVIGSMIHTWVAPSDKMLSQALLRQDKPQASSRAEVRLLASDGTLVPVYLSINVLEKEERQGLLCMVLTDLTEQKRLAQKVIAASNQSRLALLSVIEDQKQAEEMLRENERGLKEAQSLGRLGNWSYDLETQTITWSEQVYQLYERDPVLGAPTPEEEAAYYSPEQAQILREYSKRAIEEGKSFDYDLEANLPTGKHLYLSAKMQPIKDANDRVVRLFGTIQDVTERKRAEEALQDSQNMLMTVLDSIPSAVFWKDRNLNYLGGNRSWLEAAGLKSLEEVIGKSDYDLPWGKKQADSFREYDRKVMESGIPEYDIIEPYLRADGTHAWAKTNKVPLRDTEGNVIGTLGTYDESPSARKRRKRFGRARRSIGRCLKRWHREWFIRLPKER